MPTYRRGRALVGGIAAAAVAHTLLFAVPANADDADPFASVSTTITRITEAAAQLGAGQPSVAIESPVDGAPLPQGGLGEVTVSVADESALDRLIVNLYDANGTFLRAIGATSATASIGARTWTGSFPIPADLEVGAYMIRASASDAAGNIEFVSSEFRVVDSATAGAPVGADAEAVPGWLVALVGKVVATVFASVQG